MIAADHGGWKLKEQIKKAFPQVEWIDCGTDSESVSVDYPDFADRVCATLIENSHIDAIEGEQDPHTEPLAILVCGSGQGMAMRANKYPSIRAALVWSLESTRLAREHNGANVLCLGGRLLDEDLALDCVSAFLTTPFSGGRHLTRIQKVNPSPHTLSQDGRKD